MRLAITIAITALLGACSLYDSGPSGCDWKGHHHQVGEVFPDDCNTCTCQSDGNATCTLIGCGVDGGVDANPASCAPDNVCPSGPACGAYCCGAGEHCVNGACMCGDRAGCGTGDTCSSFGPSGGTACGSICCGASGPCPL